MNLANTPQIAGGCERLSLRTVLADRSIEPESVAKDENASMQWLVRNSLRGSRAMPDAIVFTGAVGKEPSTVLFGRTPASVVRKAIKIALSLR